MAKVLVIRISSFGDVAMLVPVLYSVAAKYPHDRFSIITRRSFAPFFENLGFNINIISLDTNSKHRGILGFFRILGKTLFTGFTHVADEHDVLRSVVLRVLMMLTGKKVAHIDKGKSEKREMIRTKAVDMPLKSTIQRYRDVFDKLGFPAPMLFTNYFEFIPRDFSHLKSIITEKNGQWIGIAPFARHQGKTYPQDKMEEVIQTLSKQKGRTIFLFGSGKNEAKIAEQWAAKYPNVVQVSGRLNLRQELLLMSYIDVMLTMDSANMHLASLVQTPVVSVWGATHPALGFYGFKQDPDNAMQIDLDCRPCCVYGEVECSRPKRDYACLHGISESSIISKLEEVKSRK